MVRKIDSLVLFLVMGIAFLSCSNNRTVTINTANNLGVITGKVIDYSTSAPIANAEVILYTGGNEVVTKTISDNNKDPNLNKTGMFTFNGVAAGDFTLRIVANGYATIETQGSLTYNLYTNINSNVVKDYGRIPLYKGFNLDVYVSSYGTLLNGVTVYTFNKDMSCPIYYDSFFYSPTITGTTDSTGRAILQGLSECGQYLIVAPAIDLNGDGIYDYQTAVASTNGPTKSNTALAINMIPSQRQDPIKLISTSAEKYMDIEFNPYFDWSLGNIIMSAGPQGKMVYVFNYPVSLDYLTVTLYNVRVINTDPNYKKYINAPMNATLSAGNTVLTINPVSEFITDNTYLVNGIVSANINGYLNTYPLNDYWYIFDNSANGVGGANFTITADNFNGSVNGSGGANPVYLKFPEYVHGTYQVIAYTQAGTTTYVGSYGLQGSLSGTPPNSVYYEGNYLAGGCDGTTCPGTKVVYVVELNGIPSLNDDVSFGGPSVNNVTVAIDATDAEGNRYVQTLTLPIN